MFFSKSLNILAMGLFWAPSKRFITFFKEPGLLLSISSHLLFLHTSINGVPFFIPLNCKEISSLPDFSFNFILNIFENDFGSCKLGNMGIDGILKGVGAVLLIFGNENPGFFIGIFLIVGEVRPGLVTRSDFPGSIHVPFSQILSPLQSVSLAHEEVELLFPQPETTKNRVVIKKKIFMLSLIVCKMHGVRES